MISPMKLIKLARKWQRVTALRRKRISFPKSDGNEQHPSSSNASPLADKGHFAVYTVDQKRFEFPIKYLSNCVIRELFKLSEEEFGVPADGPITLPCDAAFIEYIVSLIRRGADRYLKKELLMFMSTRSCSHSCSFQQQQHAGHHLVVCS